MNHMECTELYVVFDKNETIHRNSNILGRTLGQAPLTSNLQLIWKSSSFLKQAALGGKGVKERWSDADEAANSCKTAVIYQLIVYHVYAKVLVSD